MADPKNPQSGPRNPNQKQEGSFAGQDAGQKDPRKSPSSANKTQPGRTEGTVPGGIDDEDFKTPAGESETPDHGDATRHKDQRPL